MGFKVWSVLSTGRTGLRKLQGTEVVTFTLGTLQNTSERKSAPFEPKKGSKGFMASSSSLMNMTELIIYILRVLKYPIIIIMLRFWCKHNLQSLLIVGSDDEEALLNGLLSKKLLHNLVRVNQDKLVSYQVHYHYTWCIWRTMCMVCPNENTDSYLFIEIKVLLQRVRNWMVNHT